MKNFLINFLLPLFAPADSLLVAPPSSGTKASLGEEEGNGDIKGDLDIINNDDDALPEVKDKPEKKEVKEETSEEVEEEVKEENEEVESEETEEDEVKEEDTDTEKEAKGLYAKLKKVSPDIFKKVPELKDAIFASKAYREVYPSIEEARESKEIVSAYNAIQELVTTGQTDKLLDEIKGTGDRQYKTFVSNFLPALWQGDKDTYYALVSPVIRQSLRSVFEKGKSSGNENLQNAALVAHIELFGNKDINKADEPLVKNDEKDPERDKLNKDKQDFFNHRYNLMQGEVATSLTGSIKGEIKQGLDPNNSLSPYVLNKLVEDIFGEINEKLGASKEHQSLMAALWKKEAEGGFTGANKKKIIDACINKARPLIPAIRLRLKTEALKGPKEEKKVIKKVEKKADLSSSNRSGTKTDKDKFAGKSDLDIINED